MAPQTEQVLRKMARHFNAIHKIILVILLSEKLLKYKLKKYVHYSLKHIQYYMCIHVNKNATRSMYSSNTLQFLCSTVWYVP